MEFRIKYSYQTLWRIHLLNPPWRSCDRIISSNISSCVRLAEQPTEAQLAYCEHKRLELEILHDFSDDICTLSYCLQTSQLKATNIETTAKWTCLYINVYKTKTIKINETDNIKISNIE